MSVAPHLVIPRMPSVFGTMGSPRQSSVPGRVFDQARSPHRRSAYAIFETAAAPLERLLPPGFQLEADPCLAVEFTCLTDIDWLAGRGYNLVSFRFPAAYRSGGESFKGWFQPVCWENMAEPILSGREDLGWSKIFADLEERPADTQSFAASASWEGFRFMDLELLELRDDPAPLPSTAPVLHHKVIPATQAWGETDASYVTLTPAGGSSATLLRHRPAHQAQLTLHRPTWEDMPTQHHIVEGLMSIPLGTLRAAGCYEARGGKDQSDQLRLP